MQMVPSRKSTAHHRWPYPTASSAGNDVLFLHDATSSPKSFNLRPDTRARAIIGPFQGALRNGETFEAVAGMTYGVVLKND